MWSQKEQFKKCDLLLRAPTIVLLLKTTVAVVGFSLTPQIANSAPLCTEVHPTSVSSSCWQPKPPEIPTEKIRGRTVRIEMSNITITRMSEISHLYSYSAVTARTIKKLQQLTHGKPWSNGASFYYSRDPLAPDAADRENTDCAVYMRYSVGDPRAKDDEDVLLNSISTSNCDEEAYDIAQIFHIATEPRIQSGSLYNNPYLNFLFDSHPDESFSKYYQAKAINISLLMLEYLGLEGDNTVDINVPVWIYKTEKRQSLINLSSKLLGRESAWHAIWLLNINTVDDPWNVKKNTYLNMPPTTTKWVLLENPSTPQEIMRNYYNNGVISDYFETEYIDFIENSLKSQKHLTPTAWVPVFDPTEITSTALITVPNNSD